MRATGAIGLYGLAFLLRVLSWPALLLGELAVAVAAPIVRARDVCLAKAREWDPRLAARGHAASAPPPNAPPRG